MVASDRSNAHAPLPVKPDERQLGLAPNDEPWADLMRAIATFLVVCLHTSSIYNLRFGAITNADWNAANCINSITRVAVPMFFMLTGYFLLKRPTSLSGGDYFKKRTVRIAIPLITWSIVYLVYSDSPNGHHITGVIIALMSGPSYYHLWFLYALPGLYLLAPVLSWALEHERARRGRYFVAVWFVAASFIPYSLLAIRRLSGSDLAFGFPFEITVGASGYLVLGALLGEAKRAPRFGLVTVIGYAVGLSGTIAGTSFLSHRDGHLSKSFYENCAPNVIVMSVAAFVLLKDFGVRVCGRPVVSSIAKRLGRTSLGIYLIHPIVLDLMRKGRLGRTLEIISDRSTPLCAPLTALLIVTISYVLVESILRIPVLRRVV